METGRGVLLLRGDGTRRHDARTRMVAVCGCLLRPDIRALALPNNFTRYILSR
jgi:hypothetical protein